VVLNEVLIKAYARLRRAPSPCRLWARRIPEEIAVNPSKNWNRETNGRIEETRKSTSGTYSAPHKRESERTIPGSSLKSLPQ